MATRRCVLIGLAAGLCLTLVVGVRAQSDSLKIAARDQLTITVLGVPEYSGKFQVDPDGMFEYPKLGRIKAAGLTTTEVAAVIRDGLAKSTLRNPQVMLEVEQSAHMRVLVTGAVHSPGSYAFAGEMHVLEAIIKASSTTEEAGDEALVIRAGATDGRQNVTVNLEKLFSGDLSNNLALRDGDTVIVQKSTPVTVSGFVNRPGQYSIRKGTTVEQALALAGGVAEQGNPKNILVKRPVPGKAKPAELKLKQSDIVLPGDTIIVNRRIL
jgi:polysaccharide biosynthesis/export protein